MKKTALTFLPGLMIISISHGQSINKARLDTLLKQAEHAHSEAVIIYKDDELIAEKYFSNGQATNKIESMSCTKSIVGLAIACLLTDELIDSLDIPISNYYPEWRQGQKQYITIRHLVNMTSGLQNDPNATSEIYPSPDFVQLALAAELSSKPGEVWAYNNKSSNLLAGVIKKITGKRMDIYISERLFKPLGITDFSWSLDSAGNPHGMSGCQIQPTDLAKIGLLLLNNGKFNDKRIISEKAISEVTNPCKQFPGYGMLWWIDHEKTISTVDDEILDKLVEANISEDFLKMATKMKGVYYSDDEYYANIFAVFGDDPWDYLKQNLGNDLRLRKKEFGGNVTYRADGYLGNYIIVVPRNKIVAIRMISEQSFENENDSFVDFDKRVLELTEE